MYKMMKSIEMAGGRDDYHAARMGNPHFYPGMPQIHPSLSLMMGPTDCGGGSVISSSSSPPVPNGYLKERQDDNKNCYSNNSSPHTPDDLSSSNKGRGRRGRYNKNNGWNDYDDRGNKIFASKSELQLHSPVHMRDVKPYKCSQCSKTFANSSYLSQHTRIHLGIKPYQCEICQRKFTQLSHLQQHVRTHTGQKPYKCRHANCTKAFSQLSNLQSHSRCHQTDKPFKCNSCYKCFSEEQALLEHIPKHKESKHLKTHICQFCGKSYTQETYLTKHMQKHSERLEAKRPPIINIPRVSLDTPHFWPKVSPDTANTLVEAINQHDACLQNNEVLSSEHMQRGGGGSDMNGNADDYVLRLSHHSASSSTPSGSSPIHPHEPLITVSTPGAIKTPPSSVSAFTPIQSMGIGGHHHHNHHLNPHHQHHPHIPDRSYLSYNTIAFPGSKLPTAGSHQFGGFGGVSNSMDMSKSSNPTGLIALTQIHQYRPPHPLMHSDFMQGLKEKTQ